MIIAIKQNADFYWHVIEKKETDQVSGKNILRWIRLNRSKFQITDEQYDTLIDYYLFQYKH